MVTVFGGINIDIKGVAPDAALGTSNPGAIVRSPGGVGRNIAHNLALLGDRVRLASLVGPDGDARLVIRETEDAGVDCSAVETVNDAVTGTYMSLCDGNGDLIVAVSDMSIMDRIETRLVTKWVRLVSKSDLIVVDANLPAEVLAALIDKAVELSIPVVGEPVSCPKSDRFSDLDGLYCVTPNEGEYLAMGGNPGMNRPLPMAEYTLITRADRGARVIGPEGPIDIPTYAVKSLEANGAGDAFVAGFAWAVRRGKDLPVAAAYGNAAAALTVAVMETVNPALSVEALETLREEAQ